MKQQTRLNQVFLDWTTDLLIYTVVLNLFAQYSNDVYFIDFTTSLAAAVVFKVLLVIIVALEHKVNKYLSSIGTKWAKKLNIFLTFAILFLSKFLILEVLDIIFGKYVEIKGFVTIVSVIIVMILSRKLLDFIYNKLDSLS